MAGDTFVDPSREHFEAFKALRRDTPIHMLNLLRFRDRAQYPADHSHTDRALTGREAYHEYGAASAPVFAKVGGCIVWRGCMESMLIGPDDKHWELAFIAAYPSANAFLAMVTDPEYQLAVVHRQAAVLTSRLIRFAPMSLADGSFG